MGKFLQSSIGFKQERNGLIKTLAPLSYLTNNGELITVPAGYITDGYSKPRFTQSLVGGRYEDDIRPSTIHDYLCQYHGYKNLDGYIVKISFKRANDIFYEAMLSAGIGKFKAVCMYLAVFLNKNKW